MAEKGAEEAAAAVDVAVPEGASIASGDNTVWTDVSLLLEAACEGRFLLAWIHLPTLIPFCLLAEKINEKERVFEPYALLKWTKHY